MVTIPGRRIEAGPTSDGEAHPTAGILIALRLNLARREGADKLSGVRRQKRGSGHIVVASLSVLSSINRGNGRSPMSQGSVSCAS